MVGVYVYSKRCRSEVNRGLYGARRCCPRQVAQVQVSLVEVAPRVGCHLDDFSASAGPSVVPGQLAVDKQI